MTPGSRSLSWPLTELSCPLPFLWHWIITVTTAVTNGPGTKLSKPQFPNLYKGDSQFPCDRIVEMTQANKCLLSADQSICQNKNLIYLWLFLLFLKNSYLLTFIFWLCWAFVAARRLSKFAASTYYFSLQCSGLSLRWLLFQSTGSVVVAHGLSCSTACGIYPEQQLNLWALHWQMDSQSLDHQESPALTIIIIYSNSKQPFNVGIINIINDETKAQRGLVTCLKSHS